MHDDDRREPRAAQQVDEFVGHALRNHDRQPRVDPQPPQVRNRRQLFDQLGERVIDDHQRIAAAEDHFVDRSDRPQSRRAPAANRRATAALSAVRKVAAEAVAAVDRADAGRHQQHAALVLVQQPRLTRRLGVADRIGHESGHVVEFFRQRQHLSQERVVRVARPHPGHEPARGKQGETPGSPQPPAVPPRRRRSGRSKTRHNSSGSRIASRTASCHVAYRGGAQVGRTTGSGADRIVTSIFQASLAEMLDSPILPTTQFNLRTADTRGST